MRTAEAKTYPLARSPAHNQPVFRILPRIRVCFFLGFLRFLRYVERV